MSEYRDTLNLPKTDFPMKTTPADEQSRIAGWKNLCPGCGKLIYQCERCGGTGQQEAGSYWNGTAYEEQPAGECPRCKKGRLVHEHKTDYVIHDGPPFANGDLHLGHVLNKVIKDVDLRFRRRYDSVTGFRPGWDCHGLPIENKVKEDARKKGVDVSELKAACGVEAQHWMEEQSKQFQSLGILADWNNPYYTMEPGYEASVLNVWQGLKDKGLVYKEMRPVPWSVENRTALALAELDHKMIKSTAAYVALWSTDLQAFLLVWTTTPWSLPSNVAVAVNASLQYAEVRINKEGNDLYFVVADSLVDTVFKDYPDREVLRHYTGEYLSENMTEYDLPLDNGKGIVVADDYVSATMGTGLVHLAPAHGGDDYRVCKANSVEYYSAINTDAKYVETTPEWLRGQKVWAGEKLVLNYLTEKHKVFKTHEYEHEYPHDERSGKPTITLATEQWFIALDKPFDGGGTLRERSLTALEEVTFQPEFGKERLKDMISKRPDWCVSRQRQWGINIPESKDIFDVWFESGSSWSQIPEHATGATVVYIEGNDQYRGWFQHSLLLSVAIRGYAPFDTVISHGFIVDSNGKKVSKRDPDYVPAKETIAKLGADTVRLWLCSNDFRKDVCASPSIVKQFSEKYGKIRNTLRYLLSNLNDYDSVIRPAPLNSLDGWVRYTFFDMLSEVRTHYANFEYHKAFQALYNFCCNQLSSTYANAMKDRLYCDKPDSDARRISQSTMYLLYAGLLESFEPMVPAMVDEFRRQLSPGNYPAEHSVTISLPNEHDEMSSVLRNWSTLWGFRNDALAQLDRLKKEKGLNKATDAEVRYFVRNPKTWQQYGVDLEDAVGCGYHTVHESATDYVEVVDRRGIYEVCSRSWKRRPDVVGGLSERDREAVNG